MWFSFWSSFWLTVVSEIRLFTVLQYCLFPLSFRYNTQKKDSMVIIDCVAIFYEQGEGGVFYRNKNKFRCRVSRIEKHLVKIKEEIW